MCVRTKLHPIPFYFRAVRRVSSAVVFPLVLIRFGNTLMLCIIIMHFELIARRRLGRRARRARSVEIKIRKKKKRKKNFSHALVPKNPNRRVGLRLINIAVNSVYSDAEQKLQPLVRARAPFPLPPPPLPYPLEFLSFSHPTRPLPTPILSRKIYGVYVAHRSLSPAA